MKVPRVEQVATRLVIGGVAAADDARRDPVLTCDEATGFIGRRLARVGEDRVAQLRRESERVRGYAPPAIAGMTMTSLFSGTAASAPPFVRASSSPMYTFT